MIFSGRQIVARGLVLNLRSATHQQQPCGIDLTLSRVSKWTSAATIDFDNSKRRGAQTCDLPFDSGDAVRLAPGAYLVDFNETIHVPLNAMASLFPRSSLWRSGVGISAGVVDAGYRGALGALMDVKNPHGVVLYRYAKLAQVVFEELSETVDGYKGVYQSSTTSAGRDGSGRDGSGRDGSGRDGSGRDGNGRDDKGRDGKGRGGNGRDGPKEE